MKQFDILDHPADIGLVAYGKTQGELLTNAILGITSIIIDLNSISPKEKRKLTITGNDFESLFTKILDEIIFLFDSEGLLVKNCIVEMLRATSLQMELQGEKFNKAKHQIKLYLKAVTYHQLEIKKNKNGIWEARVYFDV